MVKLGVSRVRHAVSVAVLTDVGKAACVSLLLVLSCVLSPAFVQASEGCTPEMKVKEGSGSSSTPYRIATLCQLQDIRSAPAAHYVLVADINASETKTWNRDKGFSPIASTATNGFSGSFVSTRNYVISSLTISRSTESNVGLFSQLAEGATIRGVILVGSRTTGGDTVGSLVGLNDDSGLSATGSVSGKESVGGLVGYQAASSDSYATGSVSGKESVGGLVGDSDGDISGSYATGSVFGDDYVGGLVGTNGGKINNSYATGSVFGVKKNVGGLVGYHGGGISGSSATGSVRGTADNVGGLVGYQAASSVTDSYATGFVSGDNDVGGLVGNSEGNISGSYATGSVSGDNYVGGLVGDSKRSGSIDNSYATGSVSGDNDVGGLVGDHSGSTRDSYATGSVSGDNSVGGLVGESSGDIIDNSYATGSGIILLAVLENRGDMNS